MQKILLLFFLYFAGATLVTNQTVEVYYDTLGGVYLNYEKGFVNQIVNPQQFQLSAGFHKITFEIINHSVRLLHYFPQRQPSIKEKETAYSPMFIKPIYIGIFRGANRKDTSKCATIEKVKEYVRYVELSERLWSGNQVRIIANYISSKCLVIDEKLYVDGKHGPINNALSAAAAAIDDIPKVAVRWYINDDYLGGWLGLAAVGSPYVVTNPNSNYWLICKYNPSEEDPNNGKLTTLTHEFGHSCGFGHGGLNGAGGTGTFTTFTAVDNYDDGGNVMGAYAGWDHPILASQYWQIVVGTKPEPWLFKYPEEGIHKYRLYAIDHPYTRHFLGTNKAFHNDSEVFDGIPFKYNCIAIRILVNKTLTSKYTGEDGTSGSIMLEYRHNPVGLQSAQEFGVRITYGFDSKGNLLMANLDHLRSWGDSEIILGDDYYPVDFDTGTLRIRVTKIHKSPLKESFAKEIPKENVRGYNEPGYAELEIEFYPNKRPPSQSPPKDIPNLIFSPSYHNCFKLNDNSGYNCSKSSTNSGWYYFINNGNRNKNAPRLYTNGNGFIKGRNSLRSYNGWEFSNSKICYGDSGLKCINIFVNQVNYRGFNRKNYANAKLTRYRLDDKNKTIEDLGVNNVIYGSGIEVPVGGRAYITDLFGNEKEIKVVTTSFLEVLPPLETDGFGEGAVVVKDKSGTVTYYNGFTLYNPENGNRVAIEYTEDGEYELSPAAIPSDKYFTTTTMIYPITIKSNKWYYYPIQRLDYNDYVLIDFRGSVPSGLKITIETDMGEYSRDLSGLNGLSSVSYKLTSREIHKATGGWYEIDRIKFNKDVEIQNIRPIYRSKVGNQIVAVNGVKEEYNFDGYRYIIETKKTEAKYIYRKVTVDINGESYSFDSTTSTKTVKSIEKKGLSTFVIVLIIIASVIVLIGAIVIICKVKSKNRGSSRAPYPSGTASTMRPMAATYAPRGTLPPAVPGGYAGGYAGGYRR